MLAWSVPDGAALWMSEFLEEVMEFIYSIDKLGAREDSSRGGAADYIPHKSRKKLRRYSLLRGNLLTRSKRLADCKAK